jgi:hypothetical protein
VVTATPRAALSPGTDNGYPGTDNGYPMHRKPGGYRAGLDWSEIISHPQGFDPRTVQPVVIPTTPVRPTLIGTEIFERPKNSQEQEWQVCVKILGEDRRDLGTGTQTDG